MKGFNYRKEDAIFTEATNTCGCKVLIKIQPTTEGTEVETKLKYCPKHEAVDDLLGGCKALLTEFANNMPNGERGAVDFVRETIASAEKGTPYAN